MTTGMRAASLWTFSVAMAYLLRYAVSVMIGLWTPDGRLAISLAAYSVFNFATIAMIGVVFFMLLWPRPSGGRRL